NMPFLAIYVASGGQDGGGLYTSDRHFAPLLRRPGRFGPGFSSLCKRAGSMTLSRVHGGVSSVLEFVRDIWGERLYERLVNLRCAGDDVAFLAIFLAGQSADAA